MPDPRVLIWYFQFNSDLFGKYGVLEYIYQQLKTKKHLVIVVAEGAGEAARDAKQLQEGVVRDASNNVKLPVHFCLK